MTGSDARQGADAASDEAAADADPPPARAVRNGAPRPLGAYLSAAAASAHQAAALALKAQDREFPWRPSLRAAGARQGERFLELARRHGDGAVARAAARRALTELQAMMDGVDRYHAAPSRPSPPIAPTVWREGSARLVDYSSTDPFSEETAGRRPALLALPSLINRARILDLTATRSFMRGMARRGVRPFLLDWGAPNAEERGFDLEDYVAARALPALEAVAERTDGPIAVLGHCMSGPLAIAAALGAEAEAARARVDKVAVVGAPWRFDAFFAGEGSEAARPSELRETIERLVAVSGAVFGGLPPDLLNTLFFMRDPLQALRKFSSFGEKDLASPSARLFVAVEDWLNDGVTLSEKAARTLLIDWSLDDALARGAWRVGGATVTPRALRSDLLCVASRADTLVPYASATGLFADAPRARLLRPRAGHIGMIVGRNAEREVWDPIARWLKS